MKSKWVERGDPKRAKLFYPISPCNFFMRYKTFFFQATNKDSTFGKLFLQLFLPQVKMKIFILLAAIFLSLHFAMSSPALLPALIRKTGPCPQWAMTVNGICKYRTPIVDIDEDLLNI